jgi:hypothetical protein
VQDTGNLGVWEATAPDVPSDIPEADEACPPASLEEEMHQEEEMHHDTQAEDDEDGEAEEAEDEEEMLIRKKQFGGLPDPCGRLLPGRTSWL